MKRIILLTALAGLLPLGMMAQDDVYFTPSKDNKTNVQKNQSYSDETPTYYSGSTRNVDEYNRRGKLSSYYQKIGADSLGNDIIEFHAGNGQYPDSVTRDTIYPGSQQYYYNDDDDFAYSRRMSRFDDYYGWYDPYFYGWAGYGPYWGTRWGWYDPWLYDDLFWGYGGWYGWYDPWYYGYGWGRPYWGWDWGPGYAWGHSGTRGHGFDGRHGGYGPGPEGGRPGGYNGGGRTFGHFGNSSRTVGNTRGTVGNGGFGNSTVQSRGGFRGSQPYNPNGNGFGSRSYTPRTTTMPSSSPRSFGAGSHSFGGGSFGGGSRGFGGGGGGHFGGGGGGHFGGHR